MNKLEQLQTEIYKIDGDWFHIGKKMQSLLSAGHVDLLCVYVTAVSDVVFIKGSPKKVSEALQNISKIL